MQTQERWRSLRLRQGFGRESNLPTLLLLLLLLLAPVIVDFCLQVGLGVP